MSTPIEPVEFDKSILMAFRALEQGVASDAQQKAALDWLIHNATRVHDLSFRVGGPEGDRLTAFSEGRRFVGLQILKLFTPEALAAKDQPKSETTGRKSRP